jgi:hypothetical protein
MKNHYRAMWHDQQSRQSGEPGRKIESTFDLPGYEFTYALPNFGFMEVTYSHKARSQDWKFHFSVHADDIEIAWDLFLDAMSSHGDKHAAKVAKPSLLEEFSDPDYGQAGKMITLYETGHYSPDEYMNLVRSIEAAFSAAGVRTNAPVKGDRKVPGGSYASYRREKDQHGRYIASADLQHLPIEEQYNPTDCDDPYLHFSLEKPMFMAPSLTF